MLLSLSWLREFTPYEGDASQLTDLLTMLGLEVEEIKRPFTGLEAVLVGKVVEKKVHPGANKLSLCRVDIGSEILDVVCGAPNVDVDQFVPLAPVGVTLPDGTKLRKAKIRGEVSHGMILSEAEMGLSQESSGIYVLPFREGEINPGERFISALKLDEEVLDVAITANRGDCLSVLGLARETAAALNLPLTLPPADFNIVADANEINLSIEINDPQTCPLYMGRVIQKVKIAKSPDNIRFRLHAVGQRPVNTVVDITNYVLFEIGQPLHAFDLGLIKSERIVIRLAHDGEEIVTLDGENRKLTAKDLLICDDDRPVALAGVMGGQNTEIRQDTQDVFLECAVFNPTLVRGTSRRLSLKSEAAYRFERGVDQAGSHFAMNRAAHLFSRIAGGMISSWAQTVEPRPHVPVKTIFRPQKASSILGLDTDQKFDADFCRQCLKNLGCRIGEIDSPSWEIETPSWRNDLAREVDLIEEVGRFYGLDKIEPELPKFSQIKLDSTSSVEKDKKAAAYLYPAFAGSYVFFQKLRNILAGIGFKEAITYSFVSAEELDAWNEPMAGKESLVRVANPLSEEGSVMRTCVSVGLMRSVKINLSNGNQDLRLFEIARTFHSDPGSETGVCEQDSLAMVITGSRRPEEFPFKNELVDFADIKGALDALLLSLGLTGGTYRVLLASKDKHWLSPAAEVSIKNRRLGVIGRLRPELADLYHARSDVFLAEIDLLTLREISEEQKTSYQSLAKFPPVRRDLTLPLPLSRPAEDILKALDHIKEPLLEEAQLVDIYLPENSQEKNLTIRLTYRHPHRTLQDKEVDAVQEKIATTLRNNLQL